MLSFTFLPFLSVSIFYHAQSCCHLLFLVVFVSALFIIAPFSAQFKNPTLSCVSLKTYPWSGDIDGNIDRHRYRHRCRHGHLYAWLITTLYWRPQSVWSCGQYKIFPLWYGKKEGIFFFSLGPFILTSQEVKLSPTNGNDQILFQTLCGLIC